MLYKICVTSDKNYSKIIQANWKVMHYGRNVKRKLIFSIVAWNRKCSYNFNWIRIKWFSKIIYNCEQKTEQEINVRFKGTYNKTWREFKYKQWVRIKLIICIDYLLLFT